MRFARFAHTDGLSVGVVEGDVEAGQNALTVAEIEGSMFGQFRFTGNRWAVADVRLLSPTLFPARSSASGATTPSTRPSSSNEVPKEPLLFLKPSTSLIGAHDTIELPPQSSRVEHEAELAVVIGGATGARRVDRAGAAKAIFGYTVANDVTARDLQRRRRAVDPGQGVRLVLPARAVDRDRAGRRPTSRSGARSTTRSASSGRTKDMVFDCRPLVSYISHMMTLLPGDVILTGTPAGVEPIVDGRRVHACGSRASASSSTRAGARGLTLDAGGRRSGLGSWRASGRCCLPGATRRGASRADGVWGNWQPN